MADIRVKRIYDEPAATDGRRVLVDRLWPRGLRRDAAAIDAWSKEVGPSHALRQWFGHAPERCEEFRRRYFAELDQEPDGVTELLSAARAGTLTLLYSARDPECNQAVVLADWLRARLATPAG